MIHYIDIASSIRVIFEIEIYLFFDYRKINLIAAYCFP